ncbi:hypothetical protein TWF694_007239 [Orbilia ellipsospora]|uniref:Uncharacterized protein n=1 Tax=Orbilia ellipsospora TaxID=2528407 RepID=A0AAV9XNV9_9PEZI
MSGSRLVSCSKLSDRTSFEDYILKLRNFTSDGKSFDQLDACKPEVCTALWGTVNADIAGPGVNSSYIIGNALGYLSLVGLIVYWEVSRYRGRSSLNKKVEEQVVKCIDALHVCVLWFCISIQIASIALLVKVDFGLDATGMEFSTMEITWSVSILALLPLIYLTFLPTDISYRSSSLPNNDFQKPDSVHDPEKETPPSRFVLFRINTIALCWILSIYPFLSRMLETFGPSKIGDGGNSVITTAEWEKIQDLCLSGVSGISDISYKVFLGFGIFGWIWFTLFTTAGLVMVYLCRQRPDSRLIPKFESYFLVTQAQKGSESTPSRRPIVMWIALAVITPMAAGINIWSIFANQKFQQDISKTTGAISATPEWGFGQIVAIIIYGPVCWEVFNLGKVFYQTQI